MPNILCMYVKCQMLIFTRDVLNLFVLSYVRQSVVGADWFRN